MLLYYGILFSHHNFFAKIVFYLFFLQSTLSKTDTFGTGTKCPSWRDVRLIESQIKGVKALGVRFTEVSVL